MCTPEYSAHQDCDYLKMEMIKTSSKVFEIIRQAESSSPRSLEGCFDMHDITASTSEYSLRQTYSFLAEMSSSGSQLCPLPWSDSPKKVRKATKSSHKSKVSWDQVHETPRKKYKPTGIALQDETRQLYLNKNKLAAAKCRVNKNIQTEKLRDKVHTCVVTNNRLKQEVMDKMEEIQMLHAAVLCHVVDGGCRAPNELRAILGLNEKLELLRDEPQLLDDADDNAKYGSATVSRTQSPEISSPNSGRQWSDTPSPAHSIERFIHGSIAHLCATKKLRAQHAQCSEEPQGTCRDANVDWKMRR